MLIFRIINNYAFYNNIKKNKTIDFLFRFETPSKSCMNMNYIDEWINIQIPSKLKLKLKFSFVNT